MGFGSEGLAIVTATAMLLGPSLACRRCRPMLAL